MQRFLRAYVEGGESEDPASPVRFVASTEGVKRDGLDLKVEDWSLENYRKYPVVLYAHDYFGHNLPIGTGEPSIDGRSLMIDVRFDAEDDFAMKVRRKAVKGMMAGSVGWDDVDVEGKVRHDLMEFSIVPVPADPDALPVRARNAFQALGRFFDKFADDDEPEEPEKPIGVPPERRDAIAPHTTEKAAEDVSWDGPAEVAKAEGAAQLKRMHSWVDSEQDADLKSAYKLPHHMAESGQVVWAGVRAAMARLFQSGTQIPDEDREGVWRHLSRHYRQFDKEPPEFRSAEYLSRLAPDEVDGLFLEGEVVDHERAGAVLSSRNKTDLEEAVRLVSGVLERAVKEEAKDEPEEEERAARTWLDAFYDLSGTSATHEVKK